MAKKKNTQWAQVGKREIELSNLEKVLFPEDGIVKAQVIAYYLNIAPTLLNYVKGRALTLIRFPDGITAKVFIRRTDPNGRHAGLNLLHWARKQKTTLLPLSRALLVWLANLASLEIHQLHSRKPTFEFARLYGL